MHIFLWVEPSGGGQRLAKRPSGPAQASTARTGRPEGLPLVTGELDVGLGAVEEGLVGDLAQVLADTGGVTLAGGDDGLEVDDLLVLAVDGALGLAQLVGEDVGEDGVVAAAVHVGEGLGSLVILAGEELDDTEVLLGVGGVGPAEEVRGGGEVVLTEGDDTLGVQDVRIVGVDLGEGVLGLGELVLAEVEGGEVELGTFAAILADGALVDLFLLVVVLHEGGGAEEGFLIQHVGVVLEELQELFGGVVLILDVGDEAGAAEFREDLTLEGGEHLGHVADLALADGRVAVHGQDAEDQVLVLDVGLADELLEAFPVFAEALDGRALDVDLLGQLLPGLAGGGGTLVGEFVVLALRAFRGRIGEDLGAGDAGAVVGVDLVDGGEEVLDGLALELGVTDVGAVHEVLDLALGGAGDDILVGVLLEGDVAGALDQHVGGVGAVGDLLHGEGDLTGALEGDAAQLQAGEFHAVDKVEVDALAHGLSLGGDYLVVVLDLFALVGERLHAGLTAVVHEDGSDLEAGLRVEVAFRIGDGDDSVDGTVDGFQDAGIAGDLHVLGQLGHLLDGGAGNGCGEDRGSGTEFESVLHPIDISCNMSAISQI